MLHNGHNFGFQVEKIVTITFLGKIKELWLATFLSTYFIDKMLTENSQNSQPLFYCEKCDYLTSRKNDYAKHCLTAKHQNVDNMLTENSQNSHKKYDCDCGKTFSHRQSLSIHRKKCLEKVIEICVPSESSASNLIATLMKDREELKSMISELVKGNMGQVPQSVISANNQILNNHVNSQVTNNSFNLNFFLNETCKDAMDIMEFVDSIKLTIEDLERVGELGYADGISHIFVKHLKELVKEMRPLHCCDLKREVIYVRNNNQWLKHIIDKQILIKAIKKLANENIKMIMVWKKMYPDCTEATSRKNDTYLKIVSNSMCGIDKAETEKNMEKIVRNIARCVVIDKHGGL